MTDTHAAAAAEEEPKSPPWLPALGIALFVAAGIAWSLCTSDGAPKATQPGVEGASASAPAAAPAPQ